MNALFRARAKRYLEPIYSPHFLQRLMPLFSAKKRPWRSSGMGRANCVINWGGSENRATLGVCGYQFGIEIATISRSGNSRPNHLPITPSIPDREISLALSPVVTDNFPNGKLAKP
jgi:hypothetical protein